MALTEPDLIERDAGKITAKMIAKYEVDTGKTLYPAQAGHPLVDLWAYREMLVRVAVQEVAKQNLAAFACEPMIDYLGELADVYRLAVQPATATFQFSVDEALVTDALIPTGTRVSASDSVISTTDIDVVLKTGLLLVNVTSTCTKSSTTGNGWQPAQASQLPDEIDNVDPLVSNLMASSGSSEQEDDDRLRKRTRLAPESFTSAGSRGACRLHAMQAHPNIADVAMLSPVPGTVDLYPLLSTGPLDGSVLTLVESFCSDGKVRPLTDTARTKTPVKVDYTIEVRITIYHDQDARPAKDATNSAIQNWVAPRTTTLGRDIVPSQIISALPIPGVYQVGLATPAPRMVAESEWVNCMAVTLNMTGVSDDRAITTPVTA